MPAGSPVRGEPCGSKRVQMRSNGRASKREARRVFRNEQDQLDAAEEAIYKAAPLIDVSSLRLRASAGKPSPFSL